MPLQPTSELQKGIEIPAGMLAVTTYGVVTGETVQSLLDLQRFNMQSGVNNIQYSIVHGTLVDKARNESASVMLRNPNLKYVLFIDADMTFQPDIVQKLLVTAFHPQLCHWADAVGGYCQLRGKPFLPTIDTGTGTWESHDANCGPLEVIRTGGACILVKRHVYERMEFPWYGVRPAPRPIDIMAELDNYARCKMDGRNTLREHDAWSLLEKCAREDASAQRTRADAQFPGAFFSSVGEDSNFCDKMKALGFRIVVQTDAVASHLDREAITPARHMAAVLESERWGRQAVGVLE